MGVYGHKVFEGLVLDAPSACQWPFSEVFPDLVGAKKLASCVPEWSRCLQNAISVMPRMKPLTLSQEELHKPGSRFRCRCCVYDLDWLDSANDTVNEPIRRRSEFIFDPVDKMALSGGPVLILHAPDDPVCLWTGARALLNASSGPTKLVPLQGKGHNNFLHEKYWPTLAKFL